MIAACLKWIDHRPDVDPLTGVLRTDPRTSGPSEADEAALEWALRLGEARGVAVVAITAGPAGAEAMLRDAIAAGASTAIRVDLPVAARSDDVAAALVDAFPEGVDVVVCGNWSVDRGSGSVPAFIAARQTSAQALGLISLVVPAAPAAAIRAERRLDGGRRELLRVTPPAVLSVEGGSARLRRAPLARVLSARREEIRVVRPAPARRARSTEPARVAPFRPRPRELAAPAGDNARERILALTGALVDRTPPQTIALEPQAAADHLIAQLRAWGYLE